MEQAEGISGKIFLVFVTLLFSMLFHIPDWPAVFMSSYGYEMIDRSVYERMIINYDLRTDYISNFSGLDYFTSEWLWSFGLSYFSRSLGLHPAVTFSMISLFVIWRFSYEIAAQVSVRWLPFLLNPLVVDFAFSQIRLAFAVCVVLFFWRGRYGRIATILAYCACISIHTAISLFAVIHFCAVRIAAPRVTSLFLLSTIGVFISVLIGPLRYEILSFFGDRRAEYHDMSSSSLYLLFWFLALLLLLLDWRRTISSMDGRYSIIILSLVATNFLLSGYSTRFIAASYPSLIVAMARFRSRPFNLIFLLFSPYLALQWLYWLRIL